MKNIDRDPTPAEIRDRCEKVLAERRQPGIPKRKPVYQPRVYHVPFVHFR